MVAKRVGEVVIGSHLSFNLVAVVIVIGKGGMDCGQGQVIAGGDLVHRLAELQVHDSDVGDRDARSVNVRFPAAQSRCNLNMLSQ